MNLKERGITIGDLLILIIIVLTTTTFVRTFNKDKKTSLNISNNEKLDYEEILLSRNHLENFFVNYKI